MRFILRLSTIDCMSEQQTLPQEAQQTPSPPKQEAPPVAVEVEVKPKEISAEQATKIVELHQKPKLSPEFKPDAAALNDPDRLNTYDSMDDDPVVNGLKARSVESANKTIALLKAGEPDHPFTEDEEKSYLASAQEKEWDRFLDNYPEKAEAYKDKEGVKEAFDRRRAEAAV